MIGCRFVAAVLALVWLAGCQPYRPLPATETPRSQGMAAMEAAVEAQGTDSAKADEADPALDALLPPLDALGQDASETSFDIRVDELPARQFFMGLVEGTPYNMVVSEGIQGSISLDLKAVTVPEVMLTLREVYGYEYRRRGNLFQVVPARLETAIFHVNYPDIQRSGNSDTRVSAGTVTEAENGSGGGNTNTGTRISTETATDFWASLDEALATLVGGGEGRSVVLTPQAGVVLIRAMPSEITTVRNYLRQSELTLSRQVILEAKILEVRLSQGYQAGINWSGVLGAGEDTITLAQSSTPVDNALGTGGVFSAAFDIDSFVALIELLETQGEVQVLSSPRVSTLNNQKAVIKVGSDEFFVTDVETTTTTGTATTTTPDIELTPFFSGIALDVTPQISEEGSIILHVRPSISEVSDQQKRISIGSQVLDLPLALSTIRESDSVVRARSGQVVVIGGLMQSRRSDNASRVPQLGDLDKVGGLFRQERRDARKSELVIMLRPTLADEDGWRRALEDSLDNFSGLYAEGRDSGARETAR